MPKRIRCYAAYVCVGAIKQFGERGQISIASLREQPTIEMHSLRRWILSKGLESRSVLVENFVLQFCQRLGCRDAVRILRIEAHVPKLFQILVTDGLILGRADQ